MCGINGFNFVNQGLIEQMNKSLSHRGPNGNNHFVDDKISLGHTRLSIIDLSDAASQPMAYVCKNRNLKIVFNGEIYNYIEVKESLKRLGYHFNTESDTEVIMAAYIEWGKECINKFNGMWAFCLYDEDKQILFCSRDRLGVKPFYYYHQDNKFVFSSEIKALLNHTELAVNTFDNINKSSLELYFSLGFIPAPHTIYKNVYKLEAGHNLIFNLKNSSIEEKYAYYSVPNITQKGKKNDLIEEGKSLMKDSVGLRMRSDVPVGAFLSGGLDSSTVVGEMKHFTDLQNLHTFSIGFEEKKLDETPFINIVKDAFKTQHHHYVYKQKDFEIILPFYAQIFDEPFSDYSSFPTYKVCELAKKDVTVVLSGDGGDEIFGGYPIYSIGNAVEKLLKLPKLSRMFFLKMLQRISGLDDRIFKITELIKLSLGEKKDFHAEMFSTDRYKPSIFKEWSSGKLGEALDMTENNLSEALRIYDLRNNTLADNYLVKVDRTSMAHSIEVRSPFLDYRFVEYSQRIPSNLKVNTTQNKILMRQIIADIVPEIIIKRKKAGFTPPINEFLENSVSDELYKKYLNYLKDFSEDLFNFYDNLIIWRKVRPSTINDYYLIKLIIFAKWYEHWILSK